MVSNYDSFFLLLLFCAFSSVCFTQVPDKKTINFNGKSSDEYDQNGSYDPDNLLNQYGSYEEDGSGSEDSSYDQYNNKNNNSSLIERKNNITETEIDYRLSSISYQIVTNLTTPSPTTDNTTHFSRSSIQNTTTIDTCPRAYDQYLDGYFPVTPVGTWAIHSDICVQENGVPVRKYCDIKRFWHKTQGRCYYELNNTQVSKSLKRYLNISEVEDALSYCTQNVFQTPNQLRQTDIYFIFRILQQASDNVSVINNPKLFYETVSNIMNLEKNVLESSQALFNSTDNILYSLDKVLVKTKKLKYSSNSLHIDEVNMIDGAIGAIITKNKKENFTSMKIHHLHEENFTNMIENTDFEIGVRVPHSFTQNQHRFIITLFSNDHLFNSQNQINFKIGSWILSILIPEATTDSNSTIEIYYKEFQPSIRPQCNYWHYGNGRYGRWNYEKDANEYKKGVYVCMINHTTHFGMLVSNSFADDYILNMITIFGSILSIIGIIVILITALMFKKWRNKANNKVLLNISSCLLLLIVLFFISEKMRKGLPCIIIGIMLHYMVLVLFSWMLIISHSSYRRLCLGRHYHIDDALIKYSIICWGIPLIAVGIVAGLSTETYNKIYSTSEICYPKGIYFQLGLLMPMMIIIVLNSIIYGLIIRKLSSATLIIRKNKIEKKYSEHKVFVLLFFMLGISWIFGFLATFTNIAIFTYLFCIMTTCHGFVMFIYYVLDAEDTKEMWTKKIRSCFKKTEQIDGSLTMTSFNS